MPIKFYKVEQETPSTSRLLVPGFIATPYGRDYGYYLGEPARAHFVRIVQDAHFDVAALAYDEDKDEFCTVLDIERPNGKREYVFGWWEEGVNINAADGLNVHGDSVVRRCYSLLHHWGMTVLDVQQFDQVMSSYRADLRYSPCDTLEDLMRLPNGVEASPADGPEQPAGEDRKPTYENDAEDDFESDSMHWYGRPMEAPGDQAQQAS